MYVFMYLCIYVPGHTISTALVKHSELNNLFIFRNACMYLIPLLVSKDYCGH
jgi:hypothetical protein